MNTLTSSTCIVRNHDILVINTIYYYKELYSLRLIKRYDYLNLFKSFQEISSTDTFKIQRYYYYCLIMYHAIIICDGNNQINLTTL